MKTVLLHQSSLRIDLQALNKSTRWLELLSLGRKGLDRGICVTVSHLIWGQRCLACNKMRTLNSASTEWLLGCHRTISDAIELSWRGDLRTRSEDGIEEI